jgi:hypothetical protein
MRHASTCGNTSGPRVRRDSCRDRCTCTSGTRSPRDHRGGTRPCTARSRTARRGCGGGGQGGDGRLRPYAQLGRTPSSTDQASRWPARQSRKFRLAGVPSRPPRFRLARYVVVPVLRWGPPPRYPYQSPKTWTVACKGREEVQGLDLLRDPSGVSRRAEPQGPIPCLGGPGACLRKPTAILGVPMGFGQL